MGQLRGGSATSRSLGDLAPEIRGKAHIFVARLLEAGVPAAVVETRRNISVQRAYYAQGRESLEVVNQLRKAAGLHPIDRNENDRKITWTLKSKHLDGLAFDVVPLKGGQLWWEAPYLMWLRIGEIGESCGLQWGGRWEKCPDYPHFEI